VAIFLCHCSSGTGKEIKGLKCSEGVFLMGRAVKLLFFFPAFHLGKGNSRSGTLWEELLIKQPWKL